MSATLRNPPPSDLESPALKVQPSKARRQEQGGGYQSFLPVPDEPTELPDANLRLRRIQHWADCAGAAVTERTLTPEQLPWWLEELRAAIGGEYTTESALAALRRVKKPQG